MSAKSKVEDKNKIIPYILSGVVAIISSLLLIIVFALCIQWFSLSDSVITPVNMVIKAVSILFGMILLLKHDKTKGLIKGGVFGIVYSLLAFILFSILAGSFNCGIGFFIDILLCMALGGVIGIILVNIKK